MAKKKDNTLLWLGGAAALAIIIATSKKDNKVEGIFGTNISGMSRKDKLIEVMTANQKSWIFVTKNPNKKTFNLVADINYHFSRNGKIITTKTEDGYYIMYIPKK